MWIDAAFAAALFAMAAVNGGASVIARSWSVALLVLWAFTGPPAYLIPGEIVKTLGELADFALALIAMFRFTFSRGRWWELALALTWIVQIFVHWTFADDIPTMGLWLNVLCGAQIALVCSDRIADAVAAMLRPHRYSHGALSRIDRTATRTLAGPDCRPGALRDARKRMERG